MIGIRRIKDPLDGEYWRESDIIRCWTSKIIDKHGKYQEVLTYDEKAMPSRKIITLEPEESHIEYWVERKHYHAIFVDGEAVWGLGDSLKPDTSEKIEVDQNTYNRIKSISI